MVVARSALVHFGGVAVTQALVPIANLAIYATAARALSHDAANLFFYFLTAAIVLSVISDFGLRGTVYSDVGRESGTSRSEYVALVYTLKLVFSALTIILLCGAGLLVSGANLVVGLLFGLVSITVPVADPSGQILRGIGRGHAEAMLVGLDRLAVVVGILVLHASGLASVGAMAAVLGTVGVARVLWGRRLVLESVGSSSFARGLDVAALIRRRAGAGLLLIALIVSMKLPVLTAPLLGEASEIASFAVILAIVQAALVLPSTIVFSAVPLKRQIVGSALLERAFVLRSTLAAVAIGVAISAVLILVAEPLLGLFGFAHRSNSIALAICSCAVPFMCGNHVLRMMGTANYREWRILSVALGALALQVVASIFLVSVWGSVGIIGAYVLSEVAMFVCLFVLTLRS